MYIRVLVQRKQRNDLVIDIDNVIGRLWEEQQQGGKSCTICTESLIPYCTDFHYDNFITSTNGREQD